MANLTPVSSDDSVIQLETTTLALGGPGGPMNQQAQALLNKITYLKGIVDTKGDMNKSVYDTDNDGKVDSAEYADAVAWAGVTDKPVFSTVATTGDYNDLLNAPTLSDVALSGDYADLIGSPALATVATSGSYNDLTDTPAVGETTTASNIGVAGEGVFVQKVGSDLQFKTVKAGTNISVTTTVNNEIEINATGTATGEANTASNLGDGEGVFAQKSGVDLQFKSLVAGNNVTLSSTGTEVTISSTTSGGDMLKSVYDPDDDGLIAFAQTEGVQETLISGTNIKTINSTSILGAGDIEITEGEVNTASNVGTGTGVFAQKFGVDLQFKSLKAGTNVTLSSDTESVTINSTASGGSGYQPITLAAGTFQQSGVNMSYSSPKHAVRFTDTLAIVGYIPTSSYPYLVAINATNPASLVFGTPVQVGSGGFNYANTFVCKLTNTTGIVFYAIQFTLYARLFSVSGTTITLEGIETTLFAGTTSYLKVGAAFSSATTGCVVYCDGGSSATWYTKRISISGTTIIFGAQVSTGVTETNNQNYIPSITYAGNSVYVAMLETSTAASTLWAGLDTGTTITSWGNISTALANNGEVLRFSDDIPGAVRPYTGASSVASIRAWPTLALSKAQKVVFGTGTFGQFETGFLGSYPTLTQTSNHALVMFGGTVRGVGAIKAVANDFSANPVAFLDLTSSSWTSTHPTGGRIVALSDSLALLVGATTTDKLAVLPITITNG